MAYLKIALLFLAAYVHVSHSCAPVIRQLLAPKPATTPAPTTPAPPPTVNPACFGSCSAGWRTSKSGKKCYKLSHGKMVYSGGRDNCFLMGGHTALPKTAEDVIEIGGLLSSWTRGRYNTAWVGHVLFRLGYSKWKLAPEVWYTGQPAGNGLCSEIFKGAETSGLKATDCNRKYQPAICEKSPTLPAEMPEGCPENPLAPTSIPTPVRSDGKKCPDGWHTKRGMNWCYKLFHAQVTYIDAKKTCMSNGAALAVPKDGQDVTDLADILNSEAALDGHTNRAWTGHHTVDGKWVFPSSVPWKGGQPSKGHCSEFVVTWGRNGHKGMSSLPCLHYTSKTMCQKRLQ